MGRGNGVSFSGRGVRLRRYALADRRRTGGNLCAGGVEVLKNSAKPRSGDRSAGTLAWPCVWHFRGMRLRSGERVAVSDWVCCGDAAALIRARNNEGQGETSPSFSCRRFPRASRRRCKCIMWRGTLCCEMALRVVIDCGFRHKPSRQGVVYAT